MIFTKKFKRARLASLFPALAFDPSSNLFLLDGEALGFAFICNPFYGTDANTDERINVLLTQDWPADTVMQFCLWASPDIEANLARLEEIGRGGQDFVGQVRRQRAEFFRRGTGDPLDPHTGIRVRDLQLIITVRIPTGELTPTEPTVDRVISLQKSMLQALTTIGLFPQELGVRKYIRIMSTMLNWSKDAGWRGNVSEPYDEFTPIRDQIVDYNVAAKVSATRVKLGDSCVVKTLSIKRIPDFGVLGLARHFLMEPMSGSRGIRENCLLVASLVFPDTEAKRGMLEAEKQFVTNQAFGPMMKFVPRLKVQKESYDVLLEALDRGDRLVRVYLGMVLFAKPGTEESVTSNAKTYWRELGYTLLEDKYIIFPLFLHMLPFGANPKDVKSLFRYKTMASSQALTQLPVFGGWKGSGTPALSFVGREGQIINLDLFETSSNYNAVICAQSGSGKSFLTNEIALSYLSVGGRVWIIDVGRSYEKLVKQVGGQFMCFDENSEICLNPFQMVRTYNEDADILLAILESMAAPTEGLDDFRMTELRRVTSELFAEKGSATTMDDLASALMSEEDGRVSDIGKQLFPYTSKGEYGRFFIGQNNINFSGDFTVLELEELKGKKALQKVVLLIVMFQIQQDMFLGDRDRKKMVIVDEAWDLLSGEGDQESNSVAKFMENSYRRFRKYGGSAVVITQSINDLYKTAGGLAIAENSVNKLFLGQNRETIAMCEKEGRLDIGEFGFSLLKTVQTIPGQFSEIFFITDSGFGVGRLYVDDHKKLLYSTRPEDVHLIKSYTDQGLPISVAINTIVGQRTKTKESLDMEITRAARAIHRHREEIRRVAERGTSLHKAIAQIVKKTRKKAA